MYGKNHAVECTLKVQLHVVVVVVVVVVVIIIIIIIITRALCF